MLRNIKDVFLVVALLFFSLVGGAWAACRTGSNTNSSGYVNTNDCTLSSGYGPNYVECGKYGSCDKCGGGVTYRITTPYDGRKIASCSISNSSLGPYCQNYGVIATYTYCDTQAEADSLSCLNQGKVWQNGTCKGPKEICEESGGKWDGSNCELCDEAKQMPDECEQLYNQNG